MKIHEYNEMMAYLTRPAVNRVGFDTGGTSKIKTDEFKYPVKFKNLKTGNIETVYRDKPIDYEARVKRLSTNIDIYTEVVEEHNKAIQKALDTNDASKMPKPFAQTLREKGLKDGTYHGLNQKKQIPKALDVSLSRFDLATKVINDYNAQLKFMEKEDVLKKANFTPKEIKVLSVQTVRTGPGQRVRYNPRLPIADKAQDKVKRAFEDFFGKYGNPKYAETAYNNFYNPRELLAKATGVDVGTVSRVDLKSVDPKAYEVYKRLGNADIQNILDGDVTKSFFGSSLGDLKKYINEDIAKGKKPFEEYMAKNKRETIEALLDPKNIKGSVINPLKIGAGIHTGHSIRQGALDPRIAGPQIKKETLKTLYPLDRAINIGGTRYGMSEKLPTSKHVMAENELLKINKQRFNLIEQSGDKFKIIPGKEDEFFRLQEKGKKIAREFSYADELFGVPYGTGVGTQQQVRGTINFEIFENKKGDLVSKGLVGADEAKSLAGLSDDPIARKAFAEIDKTPENKKRIMDIVWKQLEPRLKDKKDLLQTAEALGCIKKGAAEGGRIGFALGSGELKNCIKSKLNSDPQAVINKVGQEIPETRTSIMNAFKKAGTPLKWAGNTFNVALGPTGVVGLNYFLGMDPTQTADRIGLEAELAFAKPLVEGAKSVTDKIKTPLLRKAAETAAGIRIPGIMNPANALRLARIASPLGWAALGAEGLYQGGKYMLERKKLLESLTDEQRDELLKKEKQEAVMQQTRGDPEAFDYLAAAEGGRVGFGAGGAFKAGEFIFTTIRNLYKGKKGLQTGRIEKELMKKYRDEGMELIDAVTTANREAYEIVDDRKLKIVQDAMKKVDMASDDYIKLMDEELRLTDYEMYEDIKRWDNTRPDLADKTRALHFPEWAASRFGENYNEVLLRNQAQALKAQSDEIDRMYPDSDGGIQDIQQQTVTEIDEMNKANLAELLEGKKKHAVGGRVGFDEGSKPKSPGRRTFIKGITALAALPFVGKFFKMGKVLEKAQPYLGPTVEKIKGMPEWFPGLVKKLYTEGEDVTKQAAYGERQVVKRGTLEGGDDVDMIYDLDTGNVSIEVVPKKGEFSTKSGAYEKSYGLDYKKGQADEMIKGTPPDEFSVVEGRPFQVGKDDVDFDYDMVDIDEAMTDLTELEKFAKGKK